MLFFAPVFYCHQVVDALQIIPIQSSLVTTCHAKEIECVRGSPPRSAANVIQRDEHYGVKHEQKNACQSPKVLTSFRASGKTSSEARVPENSNVLIHVEDTLRQNLREMIADSFAKKTGGSLEYR